MVLQKLRGVENVGAELNNIEEAISLSRREGKWFKVVISTIC